MDDGWVGHGDHLDGSNLSFWQDSGSQLIFLSLLSSGLDSELPFLSSFPSPRHPIMFPQFAIYQSSLTPFSSIPTCLLDTPTWSPGGLQDPEKTPSDLCYLWLPRLLLFSPPPALIQLQCPPCWSSHTPGMPWMLCPCCSFSPECFPQIPTWLTSLPSSVFAQRPFVQLINPFRYCLFPFSALVFSTAITTIWQAIYVFICLASLMKAPWG